MRDSSKMRPLLPAGSDEPLRGLKQNQLVASEEKIAAMSQKTMSADSKWEARVKEYEARLKAADERVKRERQGSKERVGELENNLKCVVVPFFFLIF